MRKNKVNLQPCCNVVFVTCNVANPCPGNPSNSLNILTTHTGRHFVHLFNFSEQYDFVYLETQYIRNIIIYDVGIIVQLNVGKILCRARPK